MEKIRLHFIWVLLAFLLAACTSDWEDDNHSASKNKVRVELKMAVQVPETQQVSSRANTSDPDDPDNAVTGEMMRNWFVVIVQNGKIVELVKSETFPSSEAERDQDEVAVEIPVGNTTFYSFANMQPSEVGLDDNADANKNQALPDGFETKNYRVDGSQTTFANTMKEMVAKFGAKGIPMSNKQTVSITEDTRDVQLEVIRMLAKVKLQVSNNTDHEITIKGLTLSDMTPNEDANLKLFSSHVETDKVSAPTLNTAQKQVLRLSPNNVDGYAVSAGGSQNICFYVNESEATAENKYFVLQLQTDDGASTGNTQVNRRYAMLDWRQICRNDYRIIPIKLEDYAIEWEVEAFTPIGVLPQVEDDNENLTVTFKYYGEFHIKPNIKQLSTGQYLPSDKVFNPTFTEITSSPSGDAGTCIFDTKPRWVTVKGGYSRIEGEMGNRNGTSIYKLTIDVYKSNGTAVTLTRKVRFVKM